MNPTARTLWTALHLLALFFVLPCTALAKGAPSPSPSGVLELRHEAGYVANFVVHWIEYKTIGGQRIPIPKIWTSGNVTLGWNHTLYFPPGSRNINVASDGFVFIGTKKPVFRKSFSRPPNKCLKIYGTVFALSHAECAPGDFTELTTKARQFFEAQSQFISVIAEHLKQNADNVDDTIASITRGDHASARRQIDAAGLVSKLRQRGLISSLAEDQAVYAGRDPGGFVKVSTRGPRVFNPHTMTISVNGNATALTGGSHSQGIAFSIQNAQAARYSSAYVQSWAWQVCCGVGASVGLSIGLWADEPFDLSGVAMGIGGSAGKIGGASAVAWWQYPDAGGKALGLEVSADFTTPSLDMAYFRGWTCAVADGKGNCPKLIGN